MKSVVALLITGLVVSACASTQPTGPSMDDIATAVSATMQAMESVGATEPEATPEEPLGTTIELLPTSESEPLPLAPPDRLHVAYTDSGNVWLLQEGSEPIQLTNSANAQRLRISSDGVWVAYEWNDIEREVIELRAVSTIDGSERTLLNQAEMDSLYPLDGARHYIPGQFDFIPGTDELLMNTQAIFVGPGQAKNNDLIRINVVSGEYQPLLPPGNGGDFSISPDRSHLALIQADSVGIARIDGSGYQPTILSFEPVITYSEFMFYPLVTWSDNSSHFVLVIPSSDPLAPQPSGTIWRIPLDGSLPDEMGRISGQTYFPQLSGHPIVSPDLSRVVFTRPGDSPNSSDLFFANLDGTLETRYASGNIQWAGWNPDSVRFVFGIQSQDLQIGSVGQPSSPLAVGIDLRWLNPDEFLYMAGVRGSWSLQQGQVTGSESTLVVPAGDFISYDFVQ